jgi:hypothetical protein
LEKINYKNMHKLEEPSRELECSHTLSLGKHGKGLAILGTLKQLKWELGELNQRNKEENPREEVLTYKSQANLHEFSLLAICACTSVEF